MYNIGTMESANEILVILLSSFLALFLLLGITLLVILIKLAKTISRVVEKAEDAVESVEAATIAFKKVAGPVATGKFLINFIESILNSKKKGKD